MSYVRFKKQGLGTDQESFDSFLPQARKRRGNLAEGVAYYRRSNDRGSWLMSKDAQRRCILRATPTTLRTGVLEGSNRGLSTQAKMTTPESLRSMDDS
jgi:hypothetical protein